MKNTKTSSRCDRLYVELRSWKHSQQKYQNIVKQQNKNNELLSNSDGHYI